MKKIEQVYRELLYQAIEKNNMVFTQLELSGKLDISLSTVNLAIKKLEKMNAVSIKPMNLHIIDIRKLLYVWANTRNISKDITWKSRIDMPVREVERLIPNAIYAAYSAYKLKFHDVPADYSEVYVYASETCLNKIKKRFSTEKKEKNPNFFVLNQDKNMERYGNNSTVAQIFVDLWNLKQWYASDFLKALEKRLRL